MSNRLYYTVRNNPHALAQYNDFGYSKYTNTHPVANSALLKRLLNPDGKHLCRWCRTEMTTRRTFCSDACLNEFQFYFWPSVAMRATFERDRYTCQVCGAQPKQRRLGKLHAHHIIPLHAGGHHSLDNLTTLCVDCHKKAHRKDKP